MNLISILSACCNTIKVKSASNSPVYKSWSYLMTSYEAVSQEKSQEGTGRMAYQEVGDSKT